MTCTINQLYDYRSSLKALESYSLPFRTAYRLRKLADDINSNIKIFEDEYYKFLQTYCEKDENGGFVKTEDGSGFKIKSELLKEATTRGKEFDTFEYTISDVNFSIDDFGEISVSPQVLAGLMPFIED